MIRNFTIDIPHQMLLNYVDEIKENEIGRTRSTHGIDESCILNSSEKT
jgi:hypothetical protein